MKDEYIWMNRQGEKLCAKDISDRYLLNILRFIEKGGGYSWFLDREIIDRLFEEADKRGLDHGANKNRAVKNLIEKSMYEETLEMHWVDWCGW